MPAIRNRLRGKFASKKVVAKSQRLSDLNRQKHGKVTFDEALNILDDIPSDDDSCGDLTLSALNNQESPPTRGDSEGDKKPSCGIEGSRIIDVKCVAEQLDAGCLACSKPLTLSDIRNEQMKGIACIWHVECSACGAIRHVHTSKRHVVKNNNKKSWTYNLNTKAAVGKCIGFCPCVQVNHNILTWKGDYN